MTYHDNSNPYAASNRPRPLIELIPDNHDDIDASDEEDSFYGKDDDFLLPKNLHHKIDRLPRRVKRYSAIGLAGAFVFLLSWWTIFGPRYAAYKHEYRLMDEPPEMVYGSNARHSFKDLIQVSDLGVEYLPTKGKRLVFVGDVHGCRKELEHLLKKVDFKHKHDHLILTGDMVSKGRNNLHCRRRQVLIIIVQAPTPRASSSSSKTLAHPVSAATGKTSSSSPSPKPNGTTPPPPPPPPTTSPST